MTDQGPHPGSVEPRSRLAAWAGPCAVLLAGVSMLMVSWRKWPDLLIDFGQQLYLAWQMVEGRALYDDLICNYGPLAPYANAAAFACLGTSVMSLVLLNLLVFAGITWVTYRVLLRIGTPLAAACSGVMLMLVFGFSQMSAGGNFNYAAPYENSITVGLLPALAGMWIALRFRAARQAWWAVGCCLGLCFLSKPEVFLAGAAGVGSAAGAAAWVERWARPRVAAALWQSAAGMVAVLALAFCILWISMPAGVASSGVFRAWTATLGSDAADLAFYQRGMGLSDLGGSVRAISYSMVGWAVVLAILGGASWIVARLPSRARGASAVCVGVAVAAAGSWSLDVAEWHVGARPLQLRCLLVGVIVARQLWKARPDSPASASLRTDQLVHRFAFAAFAGVLLLKMILNVRVYHYGFVLAMPAGMLAITWLLAWFPRWVERRGGHRGAAVTCGLGLLVGFGQAHVQRSASYLAISDTAVGEGANRILANDRAHYVNPVLALLERLEPASVAVFPEGSIINFLSRSPNPTPFYNFVPTGFAIFGEARILGALRTNPPEVIVLCERDTSEFGYRYFGTDYAQQVLRWIEQGYQVERVFGARPLRGEGYGIAVLRRR